MSRFAALAWGGVFALDFGLIEGTFRIGYVVFQSTGQQGVLPSFNYAGANEEFAEQWFSHFNNRRGVLWLVAGRQRSGSQRTGESHTDINSSFVFVERIQNAFGGQWQAARREVLVHELGHQFGMRDWNPKEPNNSHPDHRNWQNSDGCVMLYGTGLQNPNDFTNDIAHFAWECIGNEQNNPPSIRGANYPL